MELIVELRDKLCAAGLDAGPDTDRLALYAPSRDKGFRGHDQPLPHPSLPDHPQPKKRPKSSYIRCAAAMPNETWQSDFTHHRLTDHAAQEVRIVNAAAGELLRELTIDPTKDYQATGAPKGPTRK